jgi:outer membrane PBP1 activator LpoA protein
MRHTLPAPRRATRAPVPALLLLVALLFELGGCGGAPERPEQTAAPPAELPAEVEEISMELPPSLFSEQFASAEEALARFDWMSASATLTSLPEETLTAGDALYSGYLQARIYYVRGEQALALTQLEQLDYPGVNPALQYRIRNLRRHILGISGQHLASAWLGDEMLRTAPPEDSAALQRGIWQDLQHLELEALQAARDEAADQRWQGWLELALLDRRETLDLAGDLYQWRLDHPEHPAAESPPGGIGYLAEQPPRVDRVALLLPFSGQLAPAGRAIRDGYLAAYYAARAGGGVHHEVLVLDEEQFDSALAAYDEALARGAGLVVGPLRKEAVAQLAVHPARPVPVLALNRIDGAPTMDGAALVQLSLSPEDEAHDIAALAFGRGARRALLVRPAGARGEKMEGALRERWLALGGSLADSVVYSSPEEYSATLKAGLGLQDSEQRARRLRDILASNIEFIPRRRRDLDAIFLLCRSPEEARSIKPLLAFHYAGKIPVYATSSIYSGTPDSRDRDLNGVNLVEMPWLLGSSPGLRVALAAGGTGSDSLTGLNALGADALLVQSRFTQLQAGPDALIRGHTGLLTMDPELKIHRELSPARFDGGELEAR